MISPLETERLLLRPLELADAVQAQVLFAHWEIVRYLGSQVPWPYPEDGAHTYFRDFALRAMERGDEWHWSLRLKSEPEVLIGAIGLVRPKADSAEDMNRGFWLGLPWQGRGLMTEASDVVTDFWFDELGFSLLRVPKAAGNKSSSRISEKNGMRLVTKTERDFVGGRLPAEIWEITAEEWRAHRAATRGR